MQIKTTNREILPVLRLLAGIAAEKTFWERNLNRTILEVSENEIKLVTFAGTRVVSIRIEGEILEPGIGCFDVKQASEYLKFTPPNATIEILEGENGINLIHPDGTVRFLTPNFTTAYEQIDVWRREVRQKGKACFRVSEKELKGILAFTSIIPKGEHPRFTLDCVQVAYKKNLILVSNTDGYRVTRAFGGAEVGKPGELLLGAEVVDTLIDVLEPKSESMIECSATENLFEIRTDRFVYLGQLRAGNFPPLGGLLRDQSAENVRMPRKDLLRALRIVAGDEDLKSVKLRVHPKGASIEFGREEQRNEGSLFELENGLSIFEGETGSSRSFGIVLDKHFLLEVVSKVRSEFLIFGIEGDHEPVTISDDTLTFIHLLAPIRNIETPVEKKRAA